MLKRTGKITALLVAAVTVISTVPVMAADANPINLADEKGEMEGVAVFSNGKYVYKGYKGNNESKIYYYDGRNDTALDGYDDYDIIRKFDNSYVSVKDGDSDDELIDLSSGEVTGDTINGLRDSAKKKLLKKLSKTSKYDTDVPIDSGNFNEIEDGFEDRWYSYEANGSDGKFYNGYVNDSGYYIDCTDAANIYVYNEDQRMVKLDKFDEEKGGVTATLDTDYTPRTIGQDSGYIYRIIHVNLTGAYKTKPSSATTDNNDSAHQLSSTYYIQKISKVQGEKEDGAYMPLSVSSYQLEISLDGDCDEAYSSLISDYTNIHDAGYFYKTTVIGGEIYIYSYDVEANYGRLNVDKVDLVDDYKVYKYETTTGRDGKTLKVLRTATTVDGHVAALKAKQDLDGIGQDNNDGIAVDANRDVWVVYEGQIRKSHQAGAFKTIYICKDSINSLDVYDDNNLVAWEKDGEVYTSVVEGRQKGIDEANEILGINTSATTSEAVTEKFGWDALPDGQKNFYDITSTKVSNRWINIDGSAYFLKSDGIMAIEWLNYHGKWYYLNSDGSMKIGWLNDNGVWYFLEANGTMKTGWLNYGGKWYYFNESGVMMSNTTINGYILGESGALVN